MDPEGALLEMARKQYHVFSHEQAIAIGVPARTIRRRVETKRWRTLHRGVYASADMAGWEQRVIGACLACGSPATASYSSAEVIWDFTPKLDVPHVTVPPTTYRKRAGVEVHRSDRLDAVGCRGFRVTHPMRTLLDLASCRAEEIVERYLDDAHRRGLIAIRRFQQFLGEPAYAKKPGAALLRDLLAYRDPDAPIGSDLETIFFRVVRMAGLPLPVPQHPVVTLDGLKYIDFAYPAAKLAIEVDGYAQRANPGAFEYDRARQNDIEELGWTFRRFTWDQVRNESAGVACKVGLALGLRPVRWRPR
jgi:hypothetical protein